MTIETVIGFDSAWTDANLGAICMIKHQEGRLVSFHPPSLVNFQEAAEIIQQVAASSDYTIVAIDQPTLVPNSESLRPVERVAGSIVNKLGGGVQPANRSRETMFGDAAPIWKFLNRIAAQENPAVAREALQGLFLIEVFPALSLPAMVPTIWHRRRAAKYNPGNKKKFMIEDWRLVADGLASLARELRLGSIEVASLEMAELKQPKKLDQDKLDAMICLLVAWIWRHHPREASMVIGDGVSGYIVTPVSNETASVLKNSSLKNCVPIDIVWSQDASRSVDKSNSNEESHVESPKIHQKINYLESDSNDEASLFKKCPECGHTFVGKGWGGIDSHWRANHEDIMPYAVAWKFIKKGEKPSVQDVAY